MVTPQASGGAALVVVADARRAEFFSQSRRFSAPEPLFVLRAADVEGAVPAQPSDQPGRAFDSHGSGRHNMEPGMSLRDEAAAHFAHAIVDRMEAAVGRGAAGLILVVAPRLLGMIRGEIARRPLAALERLEISKEMVGADAATIGRLIGERGGLQRLG